MRVPGWVVVWLAALAVAAQAQGASICAPGASVEACGGRDACAQRLAQDVQDLTARLGLCEAIAADAEAATGMERSARIREAMMLLQEGLDVCGGRGYVCSQLNIALSNVQEWAERDRPDPSQRRIQIETNRRYCLGPSTSDHSVQACRDALFSPGDPGALRRALGEKYLDRGQPADALRELRKAAELVPDDDSIAALLERARSARTDLAQACLRGRESRNCDLAVLPGEPDEFELQQQRGRLLLAEGQRAAAMRAFLIAQSLQPDNSDLARRLLPLLEQGLEDAPDDARLHAAAGTAYAALQRNREAILAFREALALNPGDETARQGLAAAREVRQRRVDAGCLTADDVQACRDLLITGEPDSSRILAHIDAIESARRQQAAQRAAQRAAEQAAEEAALAAARQASSVEESAAADADPAAEPPQVSLRFDNKPSIDGTTH